MSGHVPLSVREGGCWARLKWKVKLWREKSETLARKDGASLGSGERVLWQGPKCDLCGTQSQNLKPVVHPGRVRYFNDIAEDAPIFAPPEKRFIAACPLCIETVRRTC